MKHIYHSPPHQCFMRQSTWFKNTQMMDVKGVLWHSTGANNPNIRRYVQPDDNDPDRSYLIQMLGENTNHNDWNHSYVKKGVNAFIGKLADGTVSTVQVGEWERRPWGCGSGKNGSCNDGWIQFEICEDALTDENYFNQVYNEAVNLTAYLCKIYNIDPNGRVKYRGLIVPTILCHADSADLGLGSSHGDVRIWFRKFGKTMNDVTKDVASLLSTPKPVPTPEPQPKEDDEEMTIEQFKALMNEYRAELQDNDCGSWSESDRQWAIKNGLIYGTGTDANGEPNYAWADFLTREQAAALFHRFAKMCGMDK